MYVVEERLEKLDIDYTDATVDIPEEVFEDQDYTFDEYESFIQEKSFHVSLHDVTIVGYRPGHYEGPTLQFEIRPMHDEFLDFDKERYPNAKAYITSARFVFSNMDDARDAYELIRQAKEDMENVNGFAPVDVKLVFNGKCWIDRKLESGMYFECRDFQDADNKFTMWQVLTLA